jgi:hypothetical protein
MLTDAALRERLDALKTPLTMCDQLELRPTPRQREVLGVLGTNPSFYQTVGDDRNEMGRACLVYAMWRVLSVPCSSGIMLASGRGQDGKIMEFLESVTQRINPQLASVTGFPRWNVLRFSGQAIWELRMMANVANIVQHRAPQAIVSVVFGARGSDPAFVESCKALEEHSTHPKHTRIVVW